ncbi:MAG: hypothetical protein J6K61_07105 [Clostridia bacterium]|nr:hypothetical protein [Clostridia bacterium]
MKWTERYVTDSHDLDFNGVLSVTALSHYIQESANAQHRHLGPTLEELREKGTAFLLSRFSLSLSRAVLPYEKLRIETFTTESRGYSFNRVALVFSEEGQVGEASSVWAMVDIESRRPIRVADSGCFFPPEDYQTPPPSRIIFPADMEFDAPISHRVGYGECDLNMHMNNTRYANMLCDLLSMEGKYVSEFHIHYLNEAKYKDTLSLLHMKVGEKDLFRTLRSDGKVNVEASMVLSNI